MGGPSGAQRPLSGMGARGAQPPTTGTRRASERRCSSNVRAGALTPALSLGERGPEGYSSGCSCSSSDRGEAGSEVMRRSVASWIAFAIAASGGTIGTSPTPRTP